MIVSVTVAEGSRTAPSKFSRKAANALSRKAANVYSRKAAKRCSLGREPEESMRPIAFESRRDDM